VDPARCGPGARPRLRHTTPRGAPAPRGTPLSTASRCVTPRARRQRPHGEPQPATRHHRPNLKHATDSGPAWSRKRGTTRRDGPPQPNVVHNGRLRCSTTAPWQTTKPPVGHSTDHSTLSVSRRRVWAATCTDTQKRNAVALNIRTTERRWQHASAKGPPQAATPDSERPWEPTKPHKGSWTEGVSPLARRWSPMGGCRSTPSPTAGCGPPRHTHLVPRNPMATPVTSRRRGSPGRCH